MKIIDCIEDEEEIEKLLKHLGALDLKVRRPQSEGLFATMLIDDSDSQVPFSAPSFYQDPDYPMDCHVAS